MTGTRFHHSFTVPFQDIDAAGVVFFAHLFRYAHESYEALMTHIGFPLHGLLREQRHLLPLVHAEADYRQPLELGDTLHIQVTVEALGESSFTLRYHIEDDQQQEHASVQTVHVAVDAASRQPITLPDDLREALQDYTTA